MNSNEFLARSAEHKESIDLDSQKQTKRKEDATVILVKAGQPCLLFDGVFVPEKKYIVSAKVSL